MNPSLIVDRIEGEIAIIECGNQRFELPIYALPSEIKEGDGLEIQISVTDQKQNEAEERLNRLKSKDSGDDIIDL
jgi:hypothetical protein